MTGRIDHAARDRAKTLGGVVGRPFRRLIGTMFVGFGLAAILTVVVGVATSQPILGAIVGIAIGIVTAVDAWAPLINGDVRGAVELVSDHDCHERAEWRQETGTNVPTSPKAAERWLAEHPEGPGRSTLLLSLGRLEEAEVAIARIEPKTPEEAFGVDVLRHTFELYSTGMTDTSALHARWRSLPDERERRHRRECLALLDAMVAAASGRDPIRALADGRREIEEVHPSMRATWLLANWGSIGVLAIGSATVIASVLVGVR